MGSGFCVCSTAPDDCQDSRDAAARAAPVAYRVRAMSEEPREDWAVNREGFPGNGSTTDDEFTAADLRRHMKFERCKLRMYLDYLRGRCVKGRSRSSPFRRAKSTEAGVPEGGEHCLRRPPSVPHRAARDGRRVAEPPGGTTASVRRTPRDARTRRVAPVSDEVHPHRARARARARVRARIRHAPATPARSCSTSRGAFSLCADPCA
jgi:hypothetical protein